MRQPFNTSAGGTWGKVSALFGEGAGKTAAIRKVARQIYGRDRAVAAMDPLCGSRPLVIGKPMVIFDEVEKASPDVIKALHEILDEGVFKPEANIPLSFNSPYILGSEEVLAEDVKSLDQAVAEATVLQSPITVGRPISFKNRFAFF